MDLQENDMMGEPFTHPVPKHDLIDIQFVEEKSSNSLKNQQHDQKKED